MIYCAAPHRFSVAMDKLSSRRVQAFWVDPRTGDSTFISAYSNSGVKWFMTPGGWEDAVLLLVTPSGSAM